MRPITTALLALFVLTACGRQSADVRPLAIIPQPLHVEQYEGAFTLTDRCLIVADTADADLVRIADFLNERLRTAAGFGLAVTAESDAPAIRFVQTPGMEPEAYLLQSGPKGVRIEYTDPAGAFYGLQTLLQMFPAGIYADSRQRGTDWSVPYARIEDAPRFAYRGMHLDVCSHFFGPEYLKRYIDLMAVHKVNRFHWHLTEDQGWRIEIKRYPLLTEKGSVRPETVIGSYASKFFDGEPYGGFYTQDEIREIVRYAADRFITVIPEIEMPGHARAALACYPELSCGLEENYELATTWGVFRQVYCPKEETFRFLENVLDEVFELFPSPVIHIGGDECPKHSWKNCPNCQSLIRRLGLKDEFELQSYFIRRMEQFVNSRGREIIGWDEILQGGLAPNAKVMSWLGEEGGIEAARQRHEAVMAPHSRYYLDYYQADPETEAICMGDLVTLRTMYDYNPVPDVLTDAEKRYIIGVEGCVWTEYMADPARVEYMAWPRMTAIAESGWSSAGKDWEGFTRRLEHHLGRLDALQVGYCRAFYNPLVTLHKDSAYTRVATIGVDAPDAEIRYTLDGSEPTAASELYTQPFVVNRSQEIRAVALRGGRPIGAVTSKKMN